MAYELDFDIHDVQLSTDNNFRQTVIITVTGWNVAGIEQSITLTYGSTSIPLSFITNGTGTDSISYTFDVGGMINEFNSNTTNVLRVTATTYGASGFCQVTLVAPPIITSLSVELQGNESVAIAGLSSVRVVVEASGQFGAGIRAFPDASLYYTSVYIQEHSSTTYVLQKTEDQYISQYISTLDWTDTALTFVVSVYDDRMVKTEQTYVLPLAAHTAPTISYNIYRCRQNGDRDVNGTYIAFIATANTNPPELGTREFYVQIYNNGTFIEKVFLSNGQKIITNNGNFSPETQYVFRFYAKDNGATYGGTALEEQFTAYLPPVKQIFNVYKSRSGMSFGVAFGKKATLPEYFDSEWPIVSNGWMTSYAPATSNVGRGLMVSYSGAVDWDAAIYNERASYQSGSTTKYYPQRWRFDVRSRDASTKEHLAYSEIFQLPIADDGLTQNTYYDIITTKNLTDIPDASASVRGLVSTGAQELAGKKTFRGIIVAKSSGATPQIDFETSAATSGTRSGILYLNHFTVNSKHVPGYFVFNEKSYNSNTGDILNYGENYLLPRVDADRTANQNYNIITTKNLTDIPDASATARGLVSTGSQSFAGVKTFNGRYLNIRANNGYPALRFLNQTQGQLLGIIFPNMKTVNDVSVCDKMYIRQYSYNSTTGAFLDTWDQYVLPEATPDKTAGETYSILTSKSPVTIAQGGTGQTETTKTTTIADIITADSAVTITSATFSQWGKMAQVDITFTNTNAISVGATGNITNVAIGTLLEGKRPPSRLCGFLSGFSDGGGTPHGYVHSTGAIVITDFESRGAAYTIAAGTTMRMSAVYLLA